MLNRGLEPSFAFGMQFANCSSKLCCSVSVGPPELSRQLSARESERAPIASVDEQVESEGEDELVLERSGSESDHLPEQKPIALDVNLRQFKQLSHVPPPDAASAQPRKKKGHKNKSKGTPTTEKQLDASAAAAAAGGISSSTISSTAPAPEPPQPQPKTSLKPLPPHPTTSVELISGWRTLKHEPRSFYDYFLVRLATLLSFCSALHSACAVNSFV